MNANGPSPTPTAGATVVLALRTYLLIDSQPSWAGREEAA